MVLSHVKGLLTDPKSEWQRIREEETSVAECYRSHVLLLGAIPPIAGLIGTTQIGWQIGTADPVMLTVASGVQIALAYYVSILVAVFAIGKLIHWMGETYGAEQPLAKCLALAAHTATPLLLVGIVQLYPVMWINYIVGLPALTYTVYLLYSGVPIIMEIPPERGFLFSSAVLAVGLVALVGLLAATVVLWGIGVGPAFTS